MSGRTKLSSCCLVVGVCILMWCGLPAIANSVSDPCLTYAGNIGDPRRSVSNVPSNVQPDLCDDYTVISQNAWYRVDSALGNQLYSSCVPVNHCGTEFPIWLNGANPTANNPGPLTLTVCASDYYGDCCGLWMGSIQAKWCSGGGTTRDFYVYNLDPAPACYMAYCVGDGLPCSNGTTWNTVTHNCTSAYPSMTQPPQLLGPSTRSSTFLDGSTYTDFYFTCHVNYPHLKADDGSRFNVSLAFNDVPRSYVVIDATLSLDVVFNSSVTRGHFGTTVTCQVVCYWNNAYSTKSLPVSSTSSYWIGITYQTGSPGYYNLISVTNEIEFDESVSNVTVNFYSTVPIGCCMITVYMNFTGLPGGKHTACEITFLKNEPAFTPHPLLIKAVPSPGVTPRTGLITFLPIDEFFTVFIGYTVQEIQVHITDNTSLKLCTSSGDPHITTFDGMYYSTYALGDFVLFRSSAIRFFEVDVRQAPCSTVSCNCAVAVREGNNILGVYACDKDAAPTPIQYLTDPHVPGAIITASLDGLSFNISMPSGAYVTAKLWLGANNGWGPDMYNMNIIVYPISEDINHASGLCGNYNGIRADDTNATTALNYGLQPSQSLINANRFPPACVEYSANVPYVCQCNESSGTVICTEPSNVVVFSTYYTSICNSSSASRRRRDASDASLENSQNIVTPDDIPTQTVSTLSTPTTSIPLATATALCQATLQAIPVYTQCLKYADVAQIVNSCALDIMLSNNTGATTGVIQLFQQTCVYQVMASQNTSNPNGPNVNNILQGIQSNICLNECSGHGTCANGQCSCSNGYVASDCSIVAGTTPILTGFRRGASCDVTTQQCNTVIINANNFYLSSTSLCAVITTYYSQEVFSSSPRMVAAGQLQCPLPPIPSLLTFPSYTLIYLSNDGNSWSYPLRFTLYNSACQTCDTNGNCQIQSGTCLIAGACYSANELGSTACQMCDPSSNNAGWTVPNEPACTTTMRMTPPPTTIRQTPKPWWIQ